MALAIAFTGFFISFLTIREKTVEYVEAGNASWAGYTPLAYTGDVDGLGGGNEKCNAAYPGSHWATVDDILNLGSAYPFTETAWIYFQGETNLTSSCAFWTYGGSSGYDSPITTTGLNATLDVGTCNVSRKLACIYGSAGDW